jgi:hypothetical protein
MACTVEFGPDSLFGRAIREGFFAGLLALGLFCLIIGFKTDQNINNELVLQQRWGALAVIVVLAAIGRFLFVAFLQPTLERASSPRASSRQRRLKARLSCAATSRVSASLSSSSTRS